MERDEARWGQRPSSAPLLTWYARRPGLPSNSEVFVIVGTETGAAVRLRALSASANNCPPAIRQPEAKAVTIPWPRRKPRFSWGPKGVCILYSGGGSRSYASFHALLIFPL